MSWRCKRADDGYASPGETVLEVFGHEQSAPGLRGNGQDDRIPDAELVISSEICCREQCPRRGFDYQKVVAPTQEGRAGHGSLKSSFASENAEQLTQNLDGNNDTVMRQIAQQLEHESLSYGVV